MTWETIASDGNVVGNLQFLGDYWHFNNTIYESTAAVIKEISDNKHIGWENYKIENEMGVATLTIRKTLRPMVKEIMAIDQNDQLEGKIITAYYNGRKIMGFSRARQK